MDNFSVTGEIKRRTLRERFKTCDRSFISLQEEEKAKEHILGSTRIICTLSEHLQLDRKR